MASSQQMRRDNASEEKEILVEKDRVPKMASHFESLAEKALGSDVPHEATITEIRVGGLDATGEEQVKGSGKSEEKSASRQQGVEERAVGEQRGSNTKESQNQSAHERNQEILGKSSQEKHGLMEGGEKGRQGFVETPGGVKFKVHGGEQRGSMGEEKEKQHSHGRPQESQSKTSQEKPEKHGKRDQEKQEKQGLSLEEISKQRQTAQQNSLEAIRAAEEKYERAIESENQGLGISNTAEYMKEKGGQTMEAVKQGLQSSTQFVSEKGQQGLQATKETIIPAAQKTKELVAEKGQQGLQATKDTVVPAAQKTKDYVSEKALGTKDYVFEKAVEGGKSATGYAGKVVGAVSDTARVAGWGAAHYTLEKTAEATKAVANVAAGVAEKAVQAKDVVTGAGQKVAHFAGEKIVAAKDVVVSTEESAAEYAARKKEEAQREAEAKKSPDQSKEERIHVPEKQEGGRQEGGKASETMTVMNRGQSPYQAGELVQDATKTMANTAGEMFQDATETMAKPAEVATKKVQGGGNKEHECGGEGGGVTGSVLNAIGETIMEIGQTTKEMIAGEGHQVEHEEGKGSKKKESFDQ